MKSNKKKVILSNLLNEKLIDLDLMSGTKEEVMKELVDLISESDAVKNKKEFLKVLMKREALGTTGIGNGVAIPHAQAAGIEKSAVAFGYSKEGIDFEALDGEKTHIFFIVAMPQNETEVQLKILSKVAQLIRNKTVVNRLFRVVTKEDVIAVIKKAELEMI